MSNITDRLKKIQSKLNDKNLSKIALKAFKELTPVKTGNAKRSTVLEGNRVSAEYPYVGALNEGASPKAPKGMTEPTIDAIREYIETEFNVKLK